MIRKPCVAGSFYPLNLTPLKKSVAGFLDPSAAQEHAKAVIVPHAGYVYSGHVAGAVYSSITIPDTVVLIGPNHTGCGPGVSIMTEGTWEVPLASANVNSELASLITEETDMLSEDFSAHALEHSLEVQLPFILTLNKSATIVPITVMRARPKDCQIIGEAIASAIKRLKSDVLIVASSDMNHYESDRSTRAKDALAIERILKLDPNGLIKVTTMEGISMCGVLPAAITLSAAIALGATNARLVRYATSGDVSGDYSQVVGYAGFIIK